MSDDIMFLIGFLFVVLIAFTFSHATPGGVKTGVTLLSSASSTISTSASNTTNTVKKSVTVNKIKAPSLFNLSQTAGPIGTTVTIYGSGFTNPNNTVRFGATNILANSTDGTTLVFKVPSLPAQLCANGATNCVISAQNTQTNLGTYQVSVSNTNGSSNFLSFTVGNYSSNYGVQRPQISGVSGPQKVLPNDPAVWSLTVSVSKATTIIVSVDWGDSKVSNLGQSGTRRIDISKTQTTTLGHAYARTGNYTITFKVTDDDTGLSSSYSIPVTVIYAPPVKVSPLTLSYLSQSQGPVGTQVVLNGAGFSASPVTIHFGNTAVSATAQNYGTALYYNIPAGTPVGSYLVYVSNDLGQITNGYYFRVTNP